MIVEQSRALSVVILSAIALLVGLLFLFLRDELPRASAGHGADLDVAPAVESYLEPRERPEARVDVDANSGPGPTPLAAGLADGGSLALSAATQKIAASRYGIGRASADRAEQGESVSVFVAADVVAHWLLEAGYGEGDVEAKELESTLLRTAGVLMGLYRSMPAGITPRETKLLRSFFVVAEELEWLEHKGADDDGDIPMKAWMVVHDSFMDLPEHWRGAMDVEPTKRFRQMPDWVAGENSLDTEVK